MNQIEEQIKQQLREETEKNLVALGATLSGPRSSCALACLAYAQVLLEKTEEGSKLEQLLEELVPKLVRARVNHEIEKN
jgi:hypothetical protein